MGNYQDKHELLSPLIRDDGGLDSLSKRFSEALTYSAIKREAQNPYCILCKIRVFSYLELGKCHKFNILEIDIENSLKKFYMLERDEDYIQQKEIIDYSVKYRKAIFFSLCMQPKKKTFDEQQICFLLAARISPGKNGLNFLDLTDEKQL